MNIVYKTKKLEKILTDKRKRDKEYGTNNSKRIKMRLDAITASKTLEDLRNAPGRCHQLTGDRQGLFAIDIEHPKRLIFEPLEQPPPLKEDGGIDWSQIEEVKILEVTDYHGK